MSGRKAREKIKSVVKNKGEKMTERENKLEKLISYVGDSVYDLISSQFNEQSASYFEDKPINDDTCVDFAEWFDGWNGFEAWIDMLKKDKSFKDAVMELSEYVAYNQEPTK